MATTPGKKAGMPPSPSSSEAVSAWKRAGGKAVALNRMGITAVRPGEVLALADMYSVEFKPGTIIGGVVTVLALIAATVYAGFQIDAAIHMPPTIASITEWSDTQGPFPMTVRCIAPSGCLVSNRHNDSFSSHGDQVQQHGCIGMAAGESLVFNITFTQNTLNGFAAVWDASAPPASPHDPPGAGIQVGADANCASCPGGVFQLFTPVLGGTYLANYVQTENSTSPVAPLRREWFATLVSRDARVLPESTACADRLTPAQVAAYSQATIRITSAWYRVTVDRDNVWLSVFGVCGGALQLCLQVGACILIAWEVAKMVLPEYKARIVALVSGSGAGGAGARARVADDSAGGAGAAARPGSAALPSPRIVHFSVPHTLVDSLVLSSLSGAASITHAPRSPRSRAGTGAGAATTGAGAATKQRASLAHPATPAAAQQAPPRWGGASLDGDAEILSLSGGGIAAGGRVVMMAPPNKRN